jgi:hypothetical protein
MFGSLDYLYMPSRDVAADTRYFTDALGGECQFAIDDGGTRVAMIALGAAPPHILLTDHLETEEPILIYAVDDLASRRDELRAKGVVGRSLELPVGPAFSFTAPGMQRVAIYQPTRAEVLRSFVGRHDF